MENDILAKLEAELSNPIESERQVVYVLVEVRKLLELKRLKDSFPSLVMHCDWAVHPKLEFSRAKKLVKRMDELWDKLMPGGAGGGLSAEENDELNGILELGHFYIEFARFLENAGVRNNLFTDYNNWLYFIKQYLKVIEDCPLVCKSDDMELKHIDTIQISKEPGGFMVTSHGEVPFPITWAFYKDGTSKGLWSLPFSRTLGSHITTP